MHKTTSTSATAPGTHSRHISRTLWQGILLIIALMIMVIPGQSAASSGESQMVFKRVKTQFIAALGDPDANSGTGAQNWGIWRVDPGPRGVRLNQYDQLVEAGGIAPAQWKFDNSDWWVEENGLIMEAPEFPLPPGQYLVTGDRETVSALTVHPKGPDGEQRWELANNNTLYEVTHLPCRSARYTPASSSSTCSPYEVSTSFPVRPGTPMPSFDGCHRKDYAVLFIIGVGLNNKP